MKVMKMKKGLIGFDDIIALLMLTAILVVFIVLLNIANITGCDKKSYSEIAAERGNHIVEGNRVLLGCLNSETEYKGERRKMYELISDYYKTLEPETGQFIEEEMKKILGKEECRFVLVDKFPQIKVVSEKCIELGIQNNLNIEGCIQVKTKMMTVAGEIDVIYKQLTQLDGGACP